MRSVSFLESADFVRARPHLGGLGEIVQRQRVLSVLENKHVPRLQDMRPEPVPQKKGLLLGGIAQSGHEHRRDGLQEGARAHAGPPGVASTQIPDEVLHQVDKWRQLAPMVLKRP